MTEQRGADYGLCDAFVAEDERCLRHAPYSIWIPGDEAASWYCGAHRAWAERYAVSMASALQVTDGDTQAARRLFLAAIDHHQEAP